MPSNLPLPHICVHTFLTYSLITFLTKNHFQTSQILVCEMRIVIERQELVICDRGNNNHTIFIRKVGILLLSKNQCGRQSLCAMNFFSTENAWLSKWEKNTELLSRTSHIAKWYIKLTFCQSILLMLYREQLMFLVIIHSAFWWME